MTCRERFECAGTKKRNRRSSILHVKPSRDDLETETSVATTDGWRGGGGEGGCFSRQGPNSIASQGPINRLRDRRLWRLASIMRFYCEVATEPIRFIPALSIAVQRLTDHSFIVSLPKWVDSLDKKGEKKLKPLSSLPARPRLAAQKRLARLLSKQRPAVPRENYGRLAGQRIKRGARSSSEGAGLGSKFPRKGIRRSFGDLWLHFRLARRANECPANLATADELCLRL